MEKRLLNLRESRDVLQQQRRKIRKESLANKQAKPAQLTSLFQPSSPSKEPSTIVHVLNRLVSVVKERLLSATRTLVLDKEKRPSTGPAFPPQNRSPARNLVSHCSNGYRRNRKPLDRLKASRR